LGQDFQATLWIGLDWVSKKWTHVQLWHGGKSFSDVLNKTVSASSFKSAEMVLK